MDHLTDAEDHLIAVLSGAARGPKRNGVFALWLVVRLCAGFLPPAARERAQRTRLANVDRRLSSLSLPAPLRRALQAALRDLKDRGAANTAVVLQQLVAPARETIGPDAAQALAAAARVARTALAGPSSITV